MFKTIKNNSMGQLLERKSKFIANVIYVESVEEAEEKIKEIKKKYFDAKHNCFAYIIETGDGIGAVVKFNDDGEPSGTAGAPILNIIAGMGLSNVLVVVTRYFGGILLGTGGLSRAYSEVTRKTVEEAKTIKRAVGKEVQLIVKYEELDKIKYYLNKNNIKISDIAYLENTEILLEIEMEKLQILQNDIKNYELNVIKANILQTKFVDI